MFDLGLLHLAEKLTGVGRERFDIAPLPLGVNRVEGKRTLAGPAGAGTDGHRFAGDGDVDVLEVVLLGALDGDFAEWFVGGCDPAGSRTRLRACHAREGGGV